MTGADVVTEARTWLGTRWLHQGRNEHGVDCAGLVIKVAHALRITAFDTVDYPRRATDESMLTLCREHLLEVSSPRPGDLPVIRFDTDRHIAILGDYLYGGLSLIHATSHFPRRVVEHRFNDEWLRSKRASVLAVFRFPGVEA